MAPSPEPQPQAVDYSGRHLRVGDTVAYIGVDPVRLCEGRIAVTAPRNICVESGPHLVTFTGVPASHATPPPRPLDGTVSRDDREEPLRYPQVALTGTESRHSASLFPIDVVQDHLIQDSVSRVVLEETERRHQGAINRVDELLAVIERVHSFATRLEEFAEDALRNDDRKLYAVIAKELRARIDGPPPGREAASGSGTAQPVTEQRERPTHADGTPYRYHEIVAEGWEFCEGCHTWSTATIERPHTCTGPDNAMPHNPEDGA